MVMKVRPEHEEEEVTRGEVEQIYYEDSNGTRNAFTFPYGVGYFCAKYNLEVLWVDSDGELNGWNYEEGWEYATPNTGTLTREGVITVIGSKRKS